MSAAERSDLETVAARVAVVAAELVELRRRLHRHPELARAEHATTALVAERLGAAGLRPRVAATGTGLWCDLGPAGGPVVALRADLDALPLADVKEVPYRSSVAGAAHACGHDVHTAAVLGAGIALAALAEHGRLRHRVRLIFQPAEEAIPGGALDVIAAGGLADVAAIYAVHCDPRVDVGRVGLRAGPITAAADRVSVRLTGPGGHTARPHLTAELVSALADVVVRTPALLSRLVDPRAGLSLVWGRIAAGAAHNVIPAAGAAEGTVRVLDREAWDRAGELVPRLVDQVARPYGVTAEVDYVRGVPPVVNDPACAGRLADAARAVLGPEAVEPTGQSMGGEDFAWYLEHVPGAMARLGVRHPGRPAADLHTAEFDVDERAIGIAARLLAAVALADPGGRGQQPTV